MRWVLSIVVACSIGLLSQSAWGAARGAAANAFPASLAELPASAWATVDRVLPSVAAVHAAALRHAGLRLDEPHDWARQARRAAALPRFQLGVRRNLNDTFDLRLSDEVSVSGAGVVVGPRSSNFTQQGDRNWQLDIRALWSLPELVFNPDQLQISHEARERRREVRALLQEVNRLYFQYRQWCAVVRSRDARGLLPAVRASAPSQLGFTAAELDALTGGWFSVQVQDGSQGAEAP